MTAVAVQELRWIRRRFFRPDDIPPVNVYNEFAVLMEIREAAQRSLDAFPTSLAYDVALLRGPLAQLQVLENEAEADGELVDAAVQQQSEALTGSRKPISSLQSSAEEEKTDGPPVPQAIDPTIGGMSLSDGGSRSCVEGMDFRIRARKSRVEASSSSSGGGDDPGAESEESWMLDHCGQRIPKSNNFRNCVVQRSGEKRVLMWFVVLADVAILLLMMKASEQREIIGLLRHVLLPSSQALLSGGHGVPTAPQTIDEEALEILRNRIRELWPILLRRHPRTASQKLGIQVPVPKEDRLLHTPTEARIGASSERSAPAEPVEAKEEDCALLTLDYELLLALFNPVTRQRWFSYWEQTVMILTPLDPNPAVVLPKASAARPWF